MTKGRIEAFSDGVIAILITIMVLELRAPAVANWSGLQETLPEFCSYALSFVFLGIYWSNHHHMFQLTERVTGGMLWANLHLLFWLSLVPFATQWMWTTHFASAPLASYGTVLLLSGIAYTILQRTIIRANGADSTLAEAVGADAKGKISLVCYLAGIVASYPLPWLAGALYVFVALTWLVPDRRIEQVVQRG